MVASQAKMALQWKGVQLRTAAAQAEGEDRSVMASCKDLSELPVT